MTEQSTTTDGRGPDVVTLGEAMGLLLAVGTPLDEARDLRREVAGAELNVAVGLARLGHRTAWVGRVGDDTFGRAVLRRLRAEGVEVVATVDAERPTGLLVRDTTTSRPVTVWYRRDGSAGSALAPRDVPASLVARARVLHVTGITSALSGTAHDAVVTAVRTARDAGVVVSFDPNVRLRLAPAHVWAAHLRELAPLADLVLVGEDELGLLGDLAEPAALLDAGVSTVVVKRGARGADEHDAGGVRHVPAAPVTVLDPVGAGDAFAAGYLSGWLDGVGRPDRLARAATVAAQVVTALGDLAGLPRREELARLDSSVDVVR